MNLTVEDCARQPGDSAAILTALAEDPELLAPVKRFKRRMLDRLATATGSPSDALIVFLAVEGLRSLHLFDFDILSEAEKKNMAELPRAIAGLKLARPEAQPVSS